MGVRVEDEPLEQLLVAVDRVFDSWSGARAASYRRILGISDEWGTAVTVQKMVYGNASSRAGAGVAFTHSPRWPSEEIQPWGDYTPGNQGEDMVSGLVNTFPLTRKQAELEMREEQPSLEEAFPEVFAVLIQRIEELVVQRGWGPQDMEFTFEGSGADDLYILQTRNMDMRRADNVPRFEADEEARERMIGRGVGAGGGALAGRAVYNLSEIHHWRQEEPDTALILIRGDTVPDDIEEIHAADGLLTARGGATSHAAIVANRLGKTCVVGLSDLLCNEKGSSCSMGGARFLAGDWLSIDGQAGSVYAGQMNIIKNDLKRR
jgi:pyruvate,orthophosphate dikinase